MLTLLAVAALAALAYAVNCYRIDLVNARHRAAHHARLAAIAQHRLAAAIVDRDDALDFTDEATLLLAIDRHPVSGTSGDAREMRLRVVR